jgi:hypothetical protein
MSFPKSSSLKSLSLYHGPPCLWFFLSYLTMHVTFNSDSIELSP